jgi:hypothetical protein
MSCGSNLPLSPELCDLVLEAFDQLQCRLQLCLDPCDFLRPVIPGASLGVFEQSLVFLHLPCDVISGMLEHHLELAAFFCRCLGVLPTLLPLTLHQLLPLFACIPVQALEFRDLSLLLLAETLSVRPLLLCPLQPNHQPLNLLRFFNVSGLVIAHLFLEL